MRSGAKGRRGRHWNKNPVCVHGTQPVRGYPAGLTDFLAGLKDFPAGLNDFLAGLKEFLVTIQLFMAGLKEFLAGDGFLKPF